MASVSPVAVGSGLRRNTNHPPPPRCAASLRCLSLLRRRGSAARRCHPMVTFLARPRNVCHPTEPDLVLS
eukprot:9391832-Alexandrium_andersonii.AAC.1